MMRRTRRPTPDEHPAVRRRLWGRPRRVIKAEYLAGLPRFRQQHPELTFTQAVEQLALLHRCSPRTAWRFMRGVPTLSFDVNAALKEVLAGRAGLRVASVESLASICAATDGDTDRLERLRQLALTLRDHPGVSVYQDALDAQARGDLGGVGSRDILIGVMAGLIARQAPFRFLPSDLLPSLGEHERLYLSEPLYWITALLPENVDRVREWHLTRAVGAACVQEVKDRLARHPTSHEVYELWSRNSNQALRALMHMIGAATRRLEHRKELTPRRQRDNRSATMDDEKESVLRYLLSDRVHAKTADDHPLEILRRAMDGAFDTLPFEVRNRFIDTLRKENAEKRGGKVRAVEPLTSDWEEEVDPENGDGEEVARRTRHPVHIPHETKEVWNTVTRDIRLQELAKRLRSGPSAKLLRVLLERPDSTDVELAQRLDVTTRTIRNWRGHLRKLAR